MKRNEIKRFPLADTTIKNLEPEKKEYRVRDSTARLLYLKVAVNGRKSWQLRYKHPRTQKWGWKGLGGYPEINGQNARRLADGLTTELALERNPETAIKKRYTVEEAGNHLMENKMARGRAEGTLKSIRSSLDLYIFPMIGHMGINEVTRKDCAKLQASIENAGFFAKATLVRSTLKQLFRLAIAEGHTDVNPASELIILAMPYQAKPRPFLQEDEIPELMTKLGSYRGYPQTRAILDTQIRNICRPSMLTTMKWEHVDLDNGIWNIPAHLMKMRKKFRIPLPTQTIDVLKKQKILTKGVPEDHVWKNMQGEIDEEGRPKTISNITMSQALRKMGFKNRLVPHGCRHTASTLLRSHGWPKELVEYQLSHMDGGVAGIYHQGDLLEARRPMMQWYSDYIDALAADDEDAVNSLLAASPSFIKVSE